ncbi:MAG: hypothetical protein ABR923_11955 [Terracidiphilus sp.]
MSRYILIRRLRGPAFLLLIGILALLHQAHWIRFWHLFWPLLLILWGALLLAERAALAIDGGYPDGTFGWDSPSGTGVPPYPGQPVPQTPVAPPASSGTAIVPAEHEFDNGQNGGRL